MRPVKAHTWVKIAKQDALKDQKGYCLYCFDPMTVRSATAEHRLARSKGGSDNPDNIGASCKRCNQLKGSMSEKAFTKKIKNPVSGSDIEWWLAWSRRRINLATIRARRRIIRYFGLTDVEP